MRWRLFWHSYMTKDSFATEAQILSKNQIKTEVDDVGTEEWRMFFDWTSFKEWRLKNIFELDIVLGLKILLWSEILLRLRTSDFFWTWKPFYDCWLFTKQYFRSEDLLWLKTFLGLDIMLSRSSKNGPRMSERKKSFALRT